MIEITTCVTCYFTVLYFRITKFLINLLLIKFNLPILDGNFAIVSARTRFYAEARPEHQPLRDFPLFQAAHCQKHMRTNQYDCAA